MRVRAELFAIVLIVVAIGQLSGNASGDFEVVSEPNPPAQMNVSEYISFQVTVKNISERNVSALWYMLDVSIDRDVGDSRFPTTLDGHSFSTRYYPSARTDDAIIKTIAPNETYTFTIQWLSGQLYFGSPGDADILSGLSGRFEIYIRFQELRWNDEYEYYELVPGDETLWSAVDLGPYYIQVGTPVDEPEDKETSTPLFTGIGCGAILVIALFLSLKYAGKQKGTKKRYLGNKNKKEVHDSHNVTPRCQIEKMKEDHKIWFNSHYDAIMKGYDNCHWCIGDSEH